MYNGIINIYKDKGFTSHDVIAKMRGILKQKKIGHTGTLDPDAVGVLPVCLGCGTKLCDMLTDHDKEYVARMRLGVVTNTQDMSGTIIKEFPVEVTKEQVKEAILSFVGTYPQIPPMYSAIKINGQKLYDLARQGKEVERAPRMVTIHEIEILDMTLPEITIRVACGKGTYIRTLCHDIGEKLSCGGAMVSLKRTKVGSFTIENAIPLSKLEELRDMEKINEVVIPVDEMFSDLSAVHVAAIHMKTVLNGNSFSINQIMERMIYGDGENVRVYSNEGTFFGVYEYRAAENRFWPVKMFFEE